MDEYMVKTEYPAGTFDRPTRETPAGDLEQQAYEVRVVLLPFWVRKEPAPLSAEDEQVVRDEAAATVRNP